MDYSVKIGLAPMRRDVTPRPGIFNFEKAEERGHKIVQYIEEHFTDDRLTFVDLKGINPVDVMYNDEELPAGPDGYEFTITVGGEGKYDETIRIYANEE